ncbi:MAG: TIGR00266 family protein [Candidatus Micrarchaeaceae archaeon]
MEYKIIGNSMQALNIKLDEGELIYSDSGKLLSKSSNIKMTPKLFGGITGAIERKMTGATAMLTEFKSTEGSGSISVSGVLPGKIKEISLEEGEEFIAEKNAFIAAQDTVKFTIQAVGIGAAFFGGTGLILQKFVGPGSVFIHVTGDIIEYDLDGTLPIEVDPGHIAGFDATLQYKIKFVDNIKTAMFGGVGLFLATFSGKGKIILHSVSRLKLSSEIYREGEEESKEK